MRLTTQQQELMARCGIACSQAGADIRKAQDSVRGVTASLNELIGTLEDPGERVSWKSVRAQWLEIALLLEDAGKQFERGS